MKTSTDLSMDALEQVSGGSWWQSMLGSASVPSVDMSGPGGCGAGGVPSGDGVACWYPDQMGAAPSGWTDAPASSGGATGTGNGSGAYDTGDVSASTGGGYGGYGGYGG